MKLKLRAKLSYKTILLFILLSGIFCLLSLSGDKQKPFPVSFLVATILNGISIPLVLLSFIPCLFLSFAKGYIVTNLFSAIFLCLVFAVYKKCNREMRYEITVYIILSLLLYLLFDFEEKLLLSRSVDIILTLLLTFIFSTSVKSIKKGKSVRPSVDEIICLSLSYFALGFGLLNFNGFLPLKFVSVYAVLLFVSILGSGYAIILSAILSFPFVVYFENLSFLGIFVLLGLSALSFKGVSKIVSAVALLLVDLILAYYFNVYDEFTLYHFIVLSSACLTFILTPNHFLEQLKKALFMFKDRTLSRHSINRTRNMLSNKLFEISSVFMEMQKVFCGMDKEELTDKEKVKLLSCDVTDKTCKNCDKYGICKDNDLRRNVGRIVSTGLKKGKVTLLDLPQEFTDVCNEPNYFLSGVNKSFQDYKKRVTIEESTKSGRKLIGEGAIGIAEMLKNLAIDVGQTINFDGTKERELYNALSYEGIFVEEIMISGEEQSLVVQMLLSPVKEGREKIRKIVSGILGRKMMIVDSDVINRKKSCITLRPAPTFDAVFGASGRKKEGSTLSGDTYSLIRLKEDKFMLALSDGMGSGENANFISSSAISLIESFYKAGLNSELILSVVNKVLSINGEENYVAIDVCVIDLSLGECDFIKIGSPYSFIKSGEQVDLIESNSLPLGILENISPTVCHKTLKGGDMIILCSDGVTSSFSSSTEMLEFFKRQNRLNPQNLTDDLLSLSISKTKGKAEDDMTVIAVKIYEK